MRKKILESTVLMIIVAGVVMTGCGHSKSSNEPDTKVATEGEITEIVLDETEKTQEEGDKMVNEEQVKTIYEKAKNISIEKVVRTVTEDDEGHSDTVYDTYIMSEIDFNTGNAVTEDYAATIGDNKEFCEDDISVISMEEAFGTSLDGLDGWQLFEKVISNNGIDFRFDDVTYDKETNDITGQNLYVFNSENDIIEQLLGGVEYDELMDKKVYYQTRTDEKGIIIPDTFSAIVQYKKGAMTVTKNLFIQVNINDFE